MPYCVPILVCEPGTAIFVASEMTAVTVKGTAKGRQVYALRIVVNDASGIGNMFQFSKQKILRDFVIARHVTPCISLATSVARRLPGKLHNSVAAPSVNVSSGGPCYSIAHLHS